MLTCPRCERENPESARFCSVCGAALPVERREVRSKGLPPTQTFDLAKKRQPARPMGVGEPRQEEPPEQTGQYAHW